MVRLTITPAVAEGQQKLAEVRFGRRIAATPEDTEQETTVGTVSKTAATAKAEEPTLGDYVIGDPITHSQILDLWKSLKTEGIEGFGLEGLLRGARVYTPPPPPKPEPSAEYKALMARLRREEEERTYQRMMKQPSRMEAFSQQFPSAAARAHAFAEVNRPMNEADNGDDEVTLGDVQKQMMVILNFLISIIGVAATIWIAARWWNVTARIFLTLGGAILVLIAEVAVYSGYVWRIGEAKSKTKEPEEIREVMQSWVLGKESKGGPAGESTILLDTKSQDTDEGIRRRLKGLSQRSGPDSTRTTANKRRTLKTYSKRTRAADEEVGSLLFKKRKPEIEPATRTPDLPRLPPAQSAPPPSSIPKSSILSYFKPCRSSSATEASDPLSDSEKLVNTPPSSPPVFRKIKEPRRLRLRHSTPLSHSSDPLEGEKDEIEESRIVVGRKPRHARRTRARGAPELQDADENKLNELPDLGKIENQARPKKPPSRSKPVPTVQTTINLSSKPTFMECKTCRIVYNPLHPADVKYHAQRHAAFLRGRSKKA
ncbi:hypothetical protein CTAM01_09911 [Colletotrichum tamarilloi]|uniref:N-acetyltransferase ESCO zinc-finger domain-containing protein n=1 Tax=Colletotrichum tamarilloi TaxID=1209934 RepID=A0ABQ9R298_9PEZI|nr:uncharacterized protein CTAM01_09911 [Colletotrichum tamarilloi]KAK1492494.1 hypothetical protein CTAM01_09911 [Colletotrichum tamarilloi]